MNKIINKSFLILLPFYPLWAWAYHFVTDKPLDLLMNVLLMPVAFSFLIKSKVRVPAYLICFIIFTFYHLASTILNNTIPSETNSVYFILSDVNLFACTLLIIIENSKFDDKFIAKMNRYVFIIVILTLIVSVIQIKDPSFMFNQKLLDDGELDFWGEEIRHTAFYSFLNTNSLGISFPIFIATSLSFYGGQKKHLILLILAGIVVAFLTKSRYVMISTIIAFSQLFFDKGKSMVRRLSLIFIFVGSIFLMIFIAEQAGFNIEEIISNRILEKETEMGSAKSRVTSYEVFLLKFPENPILGVGPKTRPDVVELLNGEAPLIHVGYLSYLYYYGIVGCFFIFMAIYYLLKNSWVVGKKYNFWGSFYGLVSFCFANITFVYFNLSEMGVVLAVVYLRYYNLYDPLIYSDNESD